MLGAVMGFLRSPAVLLTVLALVYGAGVWSGISFRGWIANKQEAKAWRLTLERQKEGAALDAKALTEKHAHELKVERSKYSPAEVSRDVENKPDCVVPDAVGLRLDAAAGVPETDTGAARADAGAQVDLALSQRRLVNACSDWASQLALCTGRLNRLIERLDAAKNCDGLR